MSLSVICCLRISHFLVVFVHGRAHDLVYVEADFPVTEQLLDIVHGRHGLLHLFATRVLPKQFPLQSIICFLRKSSACDDAKKIPLILANPFFLITFVSTTLARIFRHIITSLILLFPIKTRTLRNNRAPRSRIVTQLALDSAGFVQLPLHCFQVVVGAGAVGFGDLLGHVVGEVGRPHV